MIVRIISCIHADNSCWWRAIRKHAYENQVSVMDPVKFLINLCFKAPFFEQLHTSRGHRDVWVEFVGHIFGSFDVCDWGFCRCWICSYLYLVTKSCPVCTLFGMRMGQGKRLAMLLTIITTCLIPFASAASPHFFQYVAEADSSPSIMVDPWEKK